jgi:hypothetical protein
MVGTSLPYHKSKYELAGMNTCGFVMVHVDVYFVAASQKWRRMISSNVMQSSFVAGWGMALPVPMKRFRKCLVMILCYVLKYFGGTKTS